MSKTSRSNPTSQDDKKHNAPVIKVPRPRQPPEDEPKPAHQ